jgi:hypothetical protein
MIGSVSITVYGSDFDALKRQAVKQWREFIGDSGASLPHDSELKVEEHSEKEYKATVTVRLRITEK